MKTSTKIIVSSAASLLGVALATGGAYAATGSLSVADAPGQVLKVSGVGPASTHASATAKAHANAHAKGIFGTPSPTATPTPEATDGTGASANLKSNSKSAQGAASSTDTATPVAPSVASQSASTTKGNTTGKEIEAWAHAKVQVQTVAPDAAVTVDTGANATTKGGR